MTSDSVRVLRLNWDLSHLSVQLVRIEMGQVGTSDSIRTKVGPRTKLKHTEV